MQKIIIRNFRQIEYAEIEIKKITLLIGEQASGKSTIAKLIYFFQEQGTLLAQLQLEVLREAKETFKMKTHKEIKNLYTILFKKKFQAIFNEKIVFKENTEIIFFFDEENYVRIYKPEKLPFEIIFYIDLLHNIETYIAKISDNLENIYKTTFGHLNLSEESNASFWKGALFDMNNQIKENNDNVFFPAGRSISVSYPEQFQILFFSNLASKNELNYSNDIRIMKQFIEHSAFLKDFYKTHGGDLENVLGSSEFLDININNYIITQQEYILKGKYYQNGSGETIGNKAKKINVQLSNASSGQQEAIRILQDLTYIFWGDKPAFRVIEEPEAHLYPKAQAKLLQLIALAANLTESTFILTTHSPYLISIVNNLLYYHRVIERNPKAKKALDKHFGTQKLDVANDERIYLSPDEVSVYAIDTICKSVIDAETGLIGENYLDQITEELNDDFDVILSHNIANHQLKK